MLRRYSRRSFFVLLLQTDRRECGFRRIVPAVHVRSASNPVCLVRYNLLSLSHTKSIAMPLVGYNPLAERRVLSLRGAVSLLAIAAITLSLASRVFHREFFIDHALHAATHQLVQHRDTDAAEWIPPVCSLNLLWSAEQSPTAEPVQFFYSHPQFQSLYNRPPPVS